jgi:hypothetical protein
VIDGFKMKVFDSSLEVLVTKRIGKKRDIVLLVSDGFHESRIVLTQARARVLANELRRLDAYIAAEVPP